MIWLMVFSQMSLMGGSESSRIRLQLHCNQLFYIDLQNTNFSECTAEKFV
jgi:hypothetical protein